MYSAGHASFGSLSIAHPWNSQVREDLSHLSYLQGQFPAAETKSSYLSEAVIRL